MNYELERTLNSKLLNSTIWLLFLEKNHIFLPSSFAVCQKFCNFASSKRDNSSVGRALASQAEGRGFESRLSLSNHSNNDSRIYSK